MTKAEQRKQERKKAEAAFVVACKKEMLMLEPGELRWKLLLDVVREYEAFIGSK